MTTDFEACAEACNIVKGVTLSTLPEFWLRDSGQRRQRRLRGRRYACEGW